MKEYRLNKLYSGSGMTLRHCLRHLVVSFDFAKYPEELKDSLTKVLESKKGSSDDSLMEKALDQFKKDVEVRVKF